jgi:glycosyltransferase involved in cell wall biosynthesis
VVVSEFSPGRVAVKILFLIRSLDVGGAQRQLIALAKGLRQRGHSVEVAVFYGGTILEPELLAAGVRLCHLHKQKRWEVLSFWGRLLQLTRRENPDVLYSYLPEANLPAILLKPFCRSQRIVWGVRASNVDLQLYDWAARLTFRAECLLSRFPDLIIVNSRAGRDYHRQHGVPDAKMTVIPNGIDTDRFRPDKPARARIRREWGISGQEWLIGLVGRLDPMKDHQTFLQAAALLASRRPDVRFVCIGDGPEPYCSQIKTLSKDLGLEGRLIWAGARNDLPSIYNAMDILTSASAFGEGFPNVIGEAMACGVPCVVTDVGDSARIVGETGMAVPPGNPEEMAQGWQALLKILQNQQDAPAARVRERIVDKFGVDVMVERTSAALQKLGS